MIIGAGLVAAGVLISVVSYFAAAPGGTYIVAFGPVLYGIYMIIRARME
jgi:hypothetical protein